MKFCALMCFTGFILNFYLYSFGVAETLKFVTLIVVEMLHFVYRHTEQSNVAKKEMP